MTPLVLFVLFAAAVVAGVIVTVSRLRAERAHDREREREFRRDYAPVEAEGDVKTTFIQALKGGGKLHQIWQAIGGAASIAALLLGRTADPGKRAILTMAAVAFLLLAIANRKRKPASSGVPGEKPLTLFDDPPDA